MIDAQEKNHCWVYLPDESQNKQATMLRWSGPLRQTRIYGSLARFQQKLFYKWGKDWHASMKFYR